MDVYKKMWIERKKELLDRINKAPNPNAAARDVDELTEMIYQEVLASTKEVRMKPEQIDSLCAIYVVQGKTDHHTEVKEESSQELKDAAIPMLEYLNKHFDPHATAIIKEGRVTIVRDEISVPLPIRD